MEGLHCLKYLLKENDFLCKIDLKDAYFSVLLYMSSRKFVRFAWSIKSLRVSLCLFWIKDCSQKIFKTIKGTKSSIEAAEHSPGDISRRYSSDGKSIGGNFKEQRKIDFSASTSGFCNKSEKVSSETITTNRVFRPENRCPHRHFGNNREALRLLETFCLVKTFVSECLNFN